MYLSPLDLPHIKEHSAATSVNDERYKWNCRHWDSINAWKCKLAWLTYNKFEYDGKIDPSFVEGPFQLPLSRIAAYINDPVTPRFIHVSSAGVTQPDRPGLGLSKQPPAVRLNKELDFILTFKLKREDLMRESRIPYTIVRPCALTEEPAGADLIFDKGDNITGKISREEVARICIAALESPYARNKTFEAERTQRKGGMIMCATVLVILCFIMLVLLVLKTIFL